MIQNEFPHDISEDENNIGGRNPVLEAIRSGATIERIWVANASFEGSILKIIALAKDKGIPICNCERAFLDKKFPNISHQGVGALLSPKDYCSVDDILDYAKEKNEKPFVVICDGIEDPHNLGAIIRNADAAGAHGIIIPKRNSCVVNDTVYKTSAGAAITMKVAKVTNITSLIKDLKEKGLWIFGADGEGDSTVFNSDFNCPLAIVIGSEGFGIASLVKKNCDYLISLPMRGTVSSLNASSCAAVIFYEVVRKRMNI
ncbi:MAG: 23S rRNA (guanosine(2251)-2'-O)-methyltransferase RlmB [Clostridia bacterium]